MNVTSIIALDVLKCLYKWKNALTSTLQNGVRLTINVIHVRLNLMDGRARYAAIICAQSARRLNFHRLLAQIIIQQYLGKVCA